MTTPTTPADALLLGFARALRAAGLPVTADRESGFLEAVAVVGLDDEAATYWAGRVVREGDIALATSLAASQEYFERAQTRS